MVSPREREKGSSGRARSQAPLTRHKCMFRFLLVIFLIILLGVALVALSTGKAYFTK